MHSCACLKLYHFCELKTSPLWNRPMARTRRVLKRKKMLTDEWTVDAGKAAVGAHTETAAVDAALDLVVFRAEVFRALDRRVAVGGLASIERVRRAE